MKKGKHIFISYCHENKPQVRKLRDDLIAAGEIVWWDEDITPGRDWEIKINQAMEDAYAVIACVSDESEGRYENGMYPELSDAIGRYRRFAPGSLFLFPVRLSNCKIPLIRIDATRTLNSIQRLDLFPDSEWPYAVAKLVKALKEAPAHP